MPKDPDSLAPFAPVILSRNLNSYKNYYYIRGGPKVVQDDRGLIIYAMNLNLPEMPSFHQPFEDFTKISQKFVHFFVHFCSFQSFSATFDQLLLSIYITSCLASRILLTLKKLGYQAESIWS